MAEATIVTAPSACCGAPFRMRSIAARIRTRSSGAEVTEWLLEADAVVFVPVGRHPRMLGTPGEAVVEW
ncbi:hypothetical protein [Streptomyces hydrogenans]|uniref:hypothetical protein n=1 Tax=Streptomyces hydrogenans TaxID=1873719 RepID=UPI0037FE65E1